MVIDINHIPEAPQLAEDVHETKRIGNTQIMLAHALGGRARQEDAFFVTAAAPKNYKELPAFLKNIFEKTQGDILVQGVTGSTATIAVVSPDNMLTFAHVGDSPAVLFVRDQKTGKVTAHELLAMHNHANPNEAKRATKAGGYFQGPKLVGETHNYAMTRRLGINDGIPGMSSEPEITQVNLNKFSKPGDQVFLCVSCDGLYEMGRNIKAEDYATIIEQACRAGRKNDIPHLMMDYAIQQGSEDNLTLLFSELPGSRSHTIAMGICDGHEGNSVAQSAKGLFEKALSHEVAADRQASTISRPDDDTRTWVR